MKIVMFQYNRGASAVLRQHSSMEENHPINQATNRFLASGYGDRLLWEEAADLKPRQPSHYAIAGNWQ